MPRASTKRRYGKNEFAQQGDDVYRRSVLPNLDPADHGKFAAIDIDSAAYEIDVDEMAACEKLRVRLPEAQIWIVRVGSPYVHRFGGRLHRSTS